MAAAMTRHDSRLLSRLFSEARSFGNFCTKARARPTRRQMWGRPNPSPLARWPRLPSPSWQQLALQGLGKTQPSHRISVPPFSTPPSLHPCHRTRIPKPLLGRRPIPPAAPSRVQRGSVRLSACLFQPYHSHPWPSAATMLPRLGCRAPITNRSTFGFGVLWRTCCRRRQAVDVTSRVVCGAVELSP